MALPIEDYGLIGDLQTAALVGRDGSIDWLCLPRFDSPACFAALLADERAGRWLLAPAGGGRATSRRYRGDSLVLESTWRTETGTVRVIDLMPPRGEVADVVRLVEGVDGSVEMRGELRLRFDYGRVRPWVRDRDGSVRAVAGPDAVLLHADVPVHLHEGDVLARFTVAAGERLGFVLTHAVSYRPEPAPVDAEQALAATEEYWARWAERIGSETRWPEAVRRSLIVLKALTDAPTGGIVAAATTSLPELIGGERNWDYRFCWLRDASFTLDALLGNGCLEEAEAWRSWLLRAVAGDPADLQIMYGLDGRRRLTEETLDWLPGYEGSGPVRVGNAASVQRQLDVWGEVLDTLHRARSAGLGLDQDGWAVQCALADHLCRTWDEPDNGLWEMRGPARHFVHSKVLAWTGLDRVVRAVEELGLEGPVEQWRATREEIRRDVLAKGWSPELGSFTQSYGSSEVDASLLLIAAVGFLPWTDPRIVGTVDAVGRELVQDGLLLRYRTHPEEGSDGPGLDGLPGREGAFLACSFWYAEALHRIGRGEQATELFERLLALSTDLGLLSEEYDTCAGRQLGNTPQAFSHVGLVHAARTLSRPALAE
ncbi:glycoside hydrolase family 15 protein [Actinotalea sp.]|uniref:glycoside hydrolase family 15 protein n=1 Tax=Actinotalea sp. TaxID=1872145 RepID=UPI003563C529